ncbi:MAG TPA: hypothetical protein VFV96_02230 [Verrucomicrobiae bacterium]|nr:hypothetical protein [Verrucomicrobiae bacterium]
MDSVRITTQNIEQYRGKLGFRLGDLPFEMWQVFDRSAYDACGTGMIVPIEKIVSTKNQLLDPKFIAGQKGDPRHTAFKWMTAAAKGQTKRRDPITATSARDGTFLVNDGNATIQVLMFVGWPEAPVAIVHVDDKQRVI